MNWDKINPWLNLLGNFAIVLGLIAVAVEIRGNSVALRFQETAILFDRMHEQNAMEVESEFALLYVKSLEDPAALTKAEVWSLTSYTNLRLLRVVQAYISFEAGVLDDADWRTQATSLATYLDTPVGRIIWKTLREDIADLPEIVTAIDAAIADQHLIGNHQFLDSIYNEIQELRQVAPAIPEE